MESPNNLMCVNILDNLSRLHFLSFPPWAKDMIANPKPHLNFNRPPGTALGSAKNGFSIRISSWNEVRY
eukprot:scaffold386_cov174-Ochromonas_danica.AAC.36